MLCLLSALLLCPRCVVFEYGSISRFKGVFRGFCGACVGLCCSCALRGLCGFCARVELGGLKACGVFAPIFIFFVYVFAFFFISLPAFCPSPYLLCSGCLLLVLLHCFSFSALALCFLFPLRTTRKKRGRKFLRPLLSCCGLLI